jgi:hypothetical protein
MIAELQAGNYDAVIHNGDISYADGNEWQWSVHPSFCFSLLATLS